MPCWLIKSVAQRIISVLPRSDWWNEQFQRHVTGGFRVERTGGFAEKLGACRRFVDYYFKHSRSPREDFSVFEIGTGWFPIIPIGMFLCGAREIWSMDIRRLLRRDTLDAVTECFLETERLGELEEALPRRQRERVEELARLHSGNPGLSPIEFLEQLNVHAMLGDASRTGLPDGSADLVFSHFVMEHLSPAFLPKGLAEWRRLCSSDSLMCHHIGIHDQFASFDSSITPFNYLKYSRRAWRWLDSPMISQSRLRVSDYREAISRAGFRILEEENTLGAEEDLERIKPAAEFERYSRDDLLVVFSWVVAVPV